MCYSQRMWATSSSLGCLVWLWRLSGLLSWLPGGIACWSSEAYHGPSLIAVTPASTFSPLTTPAHAATWHVWIVHTAHEARSSCSELRRAFRGLWTRERRVRGRCTADAWPCLWRVTSSRCGCVASMWRLPATFISSSSWGGGRSIELHPSTSHSQR